VYRLRGIRFSDNIEELDRLLEDIARRHPTFDDKTVTELSKIRYRLGTLNLPKDDSSAEYARRQLEIYEYFSGRHEPDLKKSECDPETEEDRLRSGSKSERSSWEAERQSIMAEMILRAMKLPEGSRIVELGAGCGDVTLAVANAGYEVTAVEIDTSSAEQIRSGTEQSERKVRVVNQDILDFVRSSSDEYDTALFVGSFHHCLQHLELLRHLSDRIEQKGIICFANEPVFLAESPFLP